MIRCISVVYSQSLSGSLCRISSVLSLIMDSRLLVSSSSPRRTCTSCLAVDMELSILQASLLLSSTCKISYTGLFSVTSATLYRWPINYIQTTHHFSKLCLCIHQKSPHEGHGVLQLLFVLCRQVIVKVKVTGLWREYELDDLVIQLIQRFDG